MTSRLRRAVDRLEAVGADQEAHEKLFAHVREREIAELAAEALTAGERIDLARQVHEDADEAALRRLAALCADAERRWNAGDRPGGRCGANR